MTFQLDEQTDTKDKPDLLAIYYAGISDEELSAQRDYYVGLVYDCFGWLEPEISMAIHYIVVERFNRLSKEADQIGNTDIHFRMTQPWGEDDGKTHTLWYPV